MPTYPGIDLLSNASATGTGVSWPGGYGEWWAEGTFGGATLTLQKQTPNGTWMAVDADAVLTAAGRMGFVLAQGDIRVAVAGGAPSALYSGVQFMSR